MKAINAYLVFNGNCREAMQFYSKCFGGDLNLMPFSEAPVDMAPEHKNLIIHSRLVKGDSVLMASDGQPGVPVRAGENYWVSVLCESVPEIERLYAAFEPGAKVTMKLQETFWTDRFAMLTDRFGINWMLNLERGKDS